MSDESIESLTSSSASLNERLARTLPRGLGPPPPHSQTASTLSAKTAETRKATKRQAMSLDSPTDDPQYESVPTISSASLDERLAQRALPRALGPPPPHSQTALALSAKSEETETATKRQAMSLDSPTDDPQCDSVSTSSSASLDERLAQQALPRGLDPPPPHSQTALALSAKCEETKTAAKRQAMSLDYPEYD